MKRRILIIPVMMISLLIEPGCSSSQIKNKPVSGIVDLQGHRGARGNRPENTLPAFQYCIEQNVFTLELDLNMTKDKKLVIYHDSKLNPDIHLDKNSKPVKPVLIRNLTLAELKELDCGSVKNKDFPQQEPVKTGIITLDELYQYVIDYEKKNNITGKIKFNIEMKFISADEKMDFIEEMAKITVKTVEEYKMTDRTTVQCFNINALPVVKKLNNKITTSALFVPTYYKGIKMMMGLDADRDDILKKTIDAGADIISPHYVYVNDGFVKKCHDKNIKVLPWTVNDEKVMVRLLNNGVDGIISDYPGRLNQTYIKWKSSVK